MKKDKIIVFLSFITVLLLFSFLWLINTFGTLDIDKILFHINMPLKGTESSMIYSYITYVSTAMLIYFISYSLIFYKNYNYHFLIQFKKWKFDINQILISHKVKICIVISLFAIVYTINKLNIVKYIINLNTDSKFIENNYYDDKKTNINFPEKKKNLIHIFVESLENSYTSTEFSGGTNNNLIPNLTNLALENISFSNNENLGGFYQGHTASWTSSALIAQTSGLPFKIPINSNDLDQYTSVLNGATTLGDILHTEGYNQTFFIGSDAEFGGRKLYFQKHGNYKIKDYIYAKNEKLIPNDYNVWWGYEDKKMFNFAKNELLNLSKKDEPFNFTMLTTDTHHVGGYVDDDCEILFENKFENAIHCSDAKIFSFINWLKEQDFYENTTIVITGDHLSMDANYFKENIDPNYQRTMYNVFINSSKNTKNIKNRLFTTFDIYPTILSSLGVSLDTNRLGLGVDLFSNSKTLAEEYGIEYLTNEIIKKSNFYNNKLLYDIDI